MRKMIWFLLITFCEVGLAKFTENAVSNLNISFIELTSLVSYRFVPLSLVTVILVIANGAVPYLQLIGVIYVLIVDAYFCVNFC